MADIYEYPIGSGNYISYPPAVLTNIASGTRLFLSGGSILDIPTGSSVLTLEGFAPLDEIVGKTIVVNSTSYTNSFKPLAGYAPAQSLSITQEKSYTVLSTEPITSAEISLSQVSTEPVTRASVEEDEYICVLLAADNCGEKFIISVEIAWDSPIQPRSGSLVTHSAAPQLIIL